MGTKLLAQALTILRLGNVDNNDLALLNSKNILNERDADKYLSKNTLYLCPTKEMVKNKNKTAYDRLIGQGSEHFRCVAIHKQSDTHASPPDEVTRNILLKHYGGAHDDLLPPFIDLAIGTRIRVTKNLATIFGNFLKPF
jgi:hypothetical protein